MKNGWTGKSGVPFWCPVIMNDQVLNGREVRTGNRICRLMQSVIIISSNMPHIR